MAFRVLAANNLLDFRTICKFRRRHLAALKGLFQQALVMCAGAGLAKLGHVSLDETKVLANASKHRAMSYARMRQEEQRLAAETDNLLAVAEEAD